MKDAGAWAADPEAAKAVAVLFAWLLKKRFPVLSEGQWLLEIAWSATAIGISQARIDQLTTMTERISSG